MKRRSWRGWMGRTTIVALVGLLAGCAAGAGAIVPVPPPVAPVVPGVGIGVRTVPPVAGVHLTAGGIGCDTDDRGIAYCVPVPITATSLHVAVPDTYRPVDDIAIALTAGANTDLIVPLTLIQTTPAWWTPITSTVRVDGMKFVDGDGHTWVWRGSTDFLLYQRFLNHEDDAVQAVVQQRVTAGANVVRVLGMVTSFSHFYPQEHADYYDRLRPFADALAAIGLRIEFVVFADAQVVMPDAGDEQRHFDRVIQAFAGASNVFIEIANEPFKNIPGGNGAVNALLARARGHGLLVATGNYNLDVVNGQYTMIVGDYVTNHPERKPDWPRTAKDEQDLRDGFGCNGEPGCVPYGGTKTPVVSDEPEGGDEVASASRSTDVDDFAYFAADTVLAGAGGTYHSSAGVTSTLWGPIQAAQATAFYAAQRWVPADAQLWPYQRGSADGGTGIGNMPMEHVDSEVPAHASDGALRTFCKGNGSDEWCVAIRPGPAWTAQARDGWRIVDQSGPRGALVHLQR